MTLQDTTGRDHSARSHAFYDQEWAAMFAPKVAKPQAKGRESQTQKLALQRSTLIGRPFSAVEQADMLQRSIGNGATLRPMTRRALKPVENQPGGDHEQEAPTGHDGRAASRGVAWNFSKIAIIAPDRAGALSWPSAAGDPLAGVMQSKLIVGDVNDPLEDEADRVADRVMRDSSDGISPTIGWPRLGRKCAACEDDGKSLQMKAAQFAPSGAYAPASVHHVLRSPGRPLDAPVRAFFEPRFGRDFGEVRVHDDERAAASASSVGALAYTVGRDIVFGGGSYAGGTDAGRRLLAHELAHVAQQGSASLYLRRVPCRGRAQCQGAIPGDPAVLGEKDEKEAQARDVAQAAAPVGSAEAAKKARRGERAVHFENLLVGHGIRVRPEVGGFFVDPARSPNVLATTQCRDFPGGSPGTPPLPGNKFCVMVPVEVEDIAKGLDINAPLTDKQRAALAGLLAVGSHEMQHATFDQARTDIWMMARGSGRAARPECTLDTVIAAPRTVGDILSEISAETAEFPVVFKNLANQQDPAAALESHERFNALTAQENLSGSITRLQCGCPCALVDDFVFTTVMFTTASWPAKQRLAFLRTMTRLIPDEWPKVLQLTEPSPPPTDPVAVTAP